ncbi:MAG: GNAT family N-acetyltransferase [Austwickia sp.]|nr:GNAT family N-acetyltransferase [Austwickia sp.]
MARSPLRIALLVEARDHASFLDLWVRRRVEAGADPEAAWRTAREGRLAAVLDDEAVVVMLAAIEHQVVGFVVAAVGPLSVLTETRALTVEDMYVDPAHRRRGVSLAMLRALAQHAERSGWRHLGVNLDAQDRAAHRTLARLGFEPTLTRRVSSTAALLRRLEAPFAVGQRAVLQRRRVQRARGGVAGCA